MVLNDGGSNIKVSDQYEKKKKRRIESLNKYIKEEWMDQKEEEED